MDNEPEYKQKSRWLQYFLGCLLAAAFSIGGIGACVGTSTGLDVDGAYQQVTQHQASILWIVFTLLVGGCTFYFRHPIRSWFSDVFAKRASSANKKEKEFDVEVSTKQANWWNKTSEQLGLKIQNAWMYHREWVYSGGAAFIILLVTLGMFHTSGVAVGSVALSAGKIIGGITWGVIFLVLLVLLFQRSKTFTAVVWAVIVGLSASGLAIWATVVMYAKHMSIWWSPLAGLMVLGLVLSVMWWMKKRPSTPVPNPTPNAPQSNTPARFKRTGPPPLVLILLLFVDLIVIIGQLTSSNWQWSMSAAMWLRAWPIWFVVLLTLLTLFADWGQADRPNGMRRSAANVVAIGFGAGLVIMALMASLFVVSKIRW